MVLLLIKFAKISLMKFNIQKMTSAPIMAGSVSRSATQNPTEVMVPTRAQRALRPSGVLVGLLAGTLAAACLVTPAFSQQIPNAPNAGQLLRETQPPPALRKPLPTIEIEQAPAPTKGSEAALTVEIKAFHFVGVTAFASSELQTLLADRIGKKLTFAELEAAANEITAYYRKQGYFGATAYLPAQSIKNGVIEIAVVEGRLGKIKLKLDPTVRLKERVIQGYLDPIPKDRTLTGRDIERALLLLNDLPGLSVSGVLEPGGEVGTGDLDVTVKEGPLVSGAVTADNLGARSAGEHRLGAEINLNDPLRIGDQLSLRGLAAQAGRLDNVGATYVLPVNSIGTKAELSYSSLNYRLGGDFAALDASGSASVAGAKLSHVLIRSRGLNLLGQFSFDAKRLEDRIGATDSVFDKRLENWTLRLVGDYSDGWLGGGVNSLGLVTTHGRLALDTESQRTFDAGTLGRQSQGRFEKWNYSFSRQQVIAPRWSLYAALNGQRASKNLDSSEKFSLGGPYGVRAFPVSEAAGDEGMTANLELRYVFATPFLPGNWMVTGFVDAGRSRINKNPSPDDTGNVHKLYASGVGLNWAGYKGVILQSSLAWKGPGHSTDNTDRTPRLYLQMSTMF